MICSWISALLPFCLSTALADSAIYEKKAPEKYCQPAAEVEKKVSSCKDNSKFLRAAIECVKKLKAERQLVLGGLQSRIQNQSVDGQNSALQKAQKTYEESQKAYDYLFQIGKVAMKEIDAYFDEIVYPDHYDSDEEILSSPCYKEVAVPLDRLAQEVEDLTVDAAGKWETFDFNRQELDKGIDSLPMSKGREEKGIRVARFPQ